MPHTTELGGVHEGTEPFDRPCDFIAVVDVDQHQQPERMVEADGRFKRACSPARLRESRGLRVKASGSDDPMRLAAERASARCLIDLRESSAPWYMAREIGRVTLDPA
jgi:hypothetical protein